MILYFSPGTCSLSPHIVARELGLELGLQRVDRAKKLQDGRDYLAVNPKGYVPALELDDGSLLTEGPAIVQYLADLAPALALAPANGTIERYRLQEMLGYINSELHKSYSPMFNSKTSADVRTESEAYLRKRYALIEKTLEGKSYLFGDQFTVADAYLFTVTRWATFLKLDLSELPNLVAFQERVGARPAVVAAIAAENALRAKV